MFKHLIQDNILKKISSTESQKRKISISELFKHTNLKKLVLNQQLNLIILVSITKSQMQAELDHISNQVLY